MSTLGTYRLLNAIDNGSYSYATLNTALATVRTKSEFQVALNDRAMLTRICTSKNCVDTIFGTAGTGAAEIEFMNADPILLCQVVPNCKLVLDKVFVAGSDQLTRLFLTIPGMINALYTSTTACKYMSKTLKNNQYFKPRISLTPLAVVAAVVDMAEITHTGSVIAITAASVMIKRKGTDEFVRLNFPAAFVPTSVAYSTIDSKVVIVGSGGTASIYVSSDGGETWTAGNVTVAMNKVLRLPSVWVAVGGVGHNVTTSSDGITWTGRVTTGSIMRDVVSNGTAYVAVGDAGNTCYSSGAGTSWSPQSSGTTVPLVSVAVDGSGNFLAVGNASSTRNIVKSITGGISWTIPTAVISTTTNLSSIVWSTEGYFIVGTSTSATNFAAYSTDATAWTIITAGSATTCNVFGSKNAASGMVIVAPAAGIGITILSKLGDLATTIYPSVDSTNAIIDTSSTSKAFVLSEGFYVNTNASGFVTNTRAM